MHTSPDSTGIGPVELPPSLWTATAPPAPDTPPLAEDKTTEVCIVGGGFTGLSAALHLSEAGARVSVLEAGEPGFGASGRNGGQVIPGLKIYPDEAAALFGADAGRRLMDWARSGADLVFDLIDRHGIACAPVRAGWIQAAHAESGLRLGEDRVRQLAAIGAPVATLSAVEVRRLIGADCYVGGWIDRAGGSVQPLAYARGLAAAAIGAGATIHGATTATDLAPDGKAWTVSARDRSGTVHTVRAERVILATNGYGDLARTAGGSGLWPGLVRSVMPAVSFQVATRPLSRPLADRILPEGQVVSDTRRLLLYFRKDPDGRLLMGGRGGPRESSDPADYRRLIDDALSVFPLLTGTAWDYHWGGTVALTTDHLPHLHEPTPGLLAAQGYNGRGVALATAMGKLLAERAGGLADADLPLPVSPIRPIPMHALRRPLMAVIGAYYGFRDRLEAGG